MAGGRYRYTVVAPAVAAVLTVSLLAVAGFARDPLLSVTVAMPDPAGAAASVPPPALTLGPTRGAAEAPVSTEITTTVTNGKVTQTRVVDSAGAPVAGSMRADGTAWVPAQPLAYKRGYMATVTATGPSGATVTETTTFTTMGQPGGARLYASVYLRDGTTYGVGMPVVVEFNAPVPEDARAAVQRRIFVKSEPAQVGGWHWYSGNVAMFRPMSLWMPGTKLTVRAALFGLPVGNRWGGSEESASVTIGRSLRMEIDNATKHLEVIQNGAVIKSIPVSLGKPSTPSSSGTTVVMSKEASTIFDTTRTDGPNGYRVQVSYAQRLTWGGEFIHAAPWSEGDQGYRNVSHGCVNVSTRDGAWLFETTLIGDPVTVRGTERALEAGNGWTAWDTPWSEFSAAAATE